MDSGSTKAYVVLEHLTLPDRGLRFFTSTSENNTHGYNGELWYKEILFTDSVEEAQAECKKINELPSMSELSDYWEQEWKRRWAAMDEMENNDYDR